MNRSIEGTILPDRMGRGLATCTLALLLGAAACSSSDGSQTADAAPGASPPAEAAAPADQAVTNATNFHLLDFVAWNNRDVDMFRRLHTADVKVNFGGGTTEGIDAHVQALQPMWQPGSELTRHAPIIAEGEWTCMVGMSGPPANMKMVTVAKWRDGAISEEYILSNLLEPGTARPAVSGSPVASISNRNPDLKRQVGAEPGWSCTLENTAEGKMVISVSKAGGTAAEQMVFAQ
ncbi:MAG TPA: nuclear transport factor 2 family protein [Longimicrobium sp.]|jgi:hypothetical protein